VFMQEHADLLNPVFWQSYKDRIGQGQLPDVFPYERERRFVKRYREGA
jgi:isocitrate dehydrogenase kinase/phosphatase